MKRIRALVDPILDIFSGLGIYTYGAFGYLTSRLDYISQVLVVFMLTVYTVLKSREDHVVLTNYGYFLAGYFVGLEGGALLKV
jgi:hypothetical protein